jgi:UDP:flavonoid glycosyltransferase YjiC (YdhE family)
MVATVEAAGFTVFAMGSGAASAPERLPLRSVDIERERQEFRERFAQRGAQQRVPLVTTLCAEWRPDVLVCDETDFGGIVAAEHLGLPYATTLVFAEGSFAPIELIAEPLNDLRATHGLPPDPDLTMLSRYLVLSLFPPGFRNPAVPLPATTHTFRSITRDPDASNAAPPFVITRPGAPTVYFTLGTIFNLESGDLFARALAGLRELPINLVVTVGQHIDPAEFGPQPNHVHIAQYIPQSLILPHCSAVISHGGSGSVLGALTYGLPSVLIPMGADQPLNAARSAELGVARVLDPVEARPEDVSKAVTIVLADPSYRKAAERLRNEITALPEPAEAVRVLERLVKG